MNGTKNNAKTCRGEKSPNCSRQAKTKPALRQIQLRPLLTKLTFVDVGVESEVVLVLQDGSDFAYGESQIEQLLDPWKVSIKLAFLNGAPGFPQRDPLVLFRRECLLGPQADQVAFQFRKEREEGDDDFRTHIMLGNIQVLLEDDHPNIARDQFIN